MKTRLRPKCLQALIFIGVLICVQAIAYGQVSFVQITDPHIFDDQWENQRNPRENEDNLLSDRAALASFINQINQRNPTAKYSFVVVTGDLGVEQLIKRLANSRGQINRALVAPTLNKAADELAALLSLSKVNVWLFVPGNNDVVDEKPENVHYYQEFIEALRASLVKLGSNVQAIDLCPAADSAGKYFSRPGLYSIADYAFIGFNNASFKNSIREAATAGRRIETYAEAQRNYAVEVGQLLNRGDIKNAYIFYHVPEIDDPWIVILKPTDALLKSRIADGALIGNSYYDSAWFVKREVREEWNKVVMNPKVKGLFAGHFHDPKRPSYEGFGWLRTTNYPPETLAKLHVCPPLALKMQSASPEHARGFREVFLDREGQVSSRIFWLTESQWGLSAQLAPPEAEARRQLALGDMYASSDRPREAEAAYAKAAESNWPPTRSEALDSLNQVMSQENTWTRKFILTPLMSGWNTGVNAFGGLLASALLSIFLIAIFWYPVKWHADETGKDQLQISTITDSPRRGLGASFQQIIGIYHGSMRANYQRRPPIQGGQKFPMLASSQSADVAELIQAIVPGGLGRVIAWLHAKTHRPKYSLGGAIQVARGRTSVFLSVNRSGQNMQTWHSVVIPGDELATSEISLTFEALQVVVKDLNNES